MTANWRASICDVGKTAAVVLLATAASFAQLDPKAEALVVCPAIREAEPQTPLGFARATLISLWYTRNAAEAGKRIEAIPKGSAPFSALTAMMRINKESINDFVCAKRAVTPFATKEDGPRSAAARLLVATYDQHIGINERMQELLINLDRTSPVELMDQISTLQVERGHRWADLVDPTAMALMLLIDQDRPDENGHLNHLFITRAQKNALIDWANEHFSEFTDGTPREQWSDPAKTAQLYFLAFQRRKASDE